MARNYLVSRHYLVSEDLKHYWEEKIKTLNFIGKGDISLNLRSNEDDKWWKEQNCEIRVEVSDDFHITISEDVDFEKLKQYLLENGCLKESTVMLNNSLRCNSGMNIYCTKNDKEGSVLMKKMRKLIFKNVNTVNIEASDKKEIEVIVFPRFYAIRVNALSDFEEVSKYLYDNGFLEGSPNKIDKKFMKEETFYATISIACDMDVFELNDKIANPLDIVLKDNNVGYIDGNEMGFGTQLSITLKNNKPTTIKKLVKICKDFAKTYTFPAKAELWVQDQVYKLN